MNILVLLLSASLLFCQTASTGPAFEAADVKPNKSGEARMAVDFQPGGRFVAHNVPMRVLIGLSHGVRPDAIKGPGWIESERYDVVAKGSPASSPEELRVMIKNLLIERFKLSTHTEQVAMPGYAMIRSRKDLRLPVSDSGLLTERRCVPGDGAPDQKHYVCRHMTMTLFAAALQEIAPREISVPVVDQTGLDGSFEFKLEWTRAARAGSAAPTDMPAGPTLFDALENQLGLKLENRKLPMPVIVIDTLNRTPSEN